MAQNFKLPKVTKINKPPKGSFKVQQGSDRLNSRNNPKTLISKTVLREYDKNSPW